MATPNYKCRYQHYLLNSLKAKKIGDVMYYNNPTENSDSLTQYMVNEVVYDYSFFNVRKPYNKFVYYYVDNNNVKKAQVIEIPEGNYSLDSAFQKFSELVNSYVSTEDTDLAPWLVNLVELTENTMRCRIQLTANGNVNPDQFPCFQLGFGKSSTGITNSIYNNLLVSKEQAEPESYYSIMLWMLGRQVPELVNKDIVQSDWVKTYDVNSNKTILEYLSPTVPQASFDTCVYLVSNYMNDFDTYISENMTDDVSNTDVNITGANINDIWLKIPVSTCNFGDRVWTWPKTPYSFTPGKSNKMLDVKNVDVFNRPIPSNNGNYAIHMTFYESRDSIYA